MSTPVQLWALDGGRFTLDRGLMVVGGSGTLTIPVPTYLIRHPRGLVLVDTGLAPAAVEDPEGTYGPLATMLGLDFTEDLRVDRQIEALGFAASDVTHVIISHSHFDHTGGISLFPNAQFLIGAPDLSYAFWPLPAASVFFRSADLEAARGFHWRPLTADLDLFGDGTIRILLMPGHTPGNTSTLVRLEDRHVLLTGDTVHVSEALTAELPMPSDHSTLDSVHSIRRLKDIAHAHEAEVIIQHDFDDWNRLREITKVSG
ncbi:N-acyl homoserine lactonase family protein [Pseudonocardia sp. RS11V-5]|uniref:N-acyl homoserine lactonase family protein n=1 Tax=Pseudonocardia terrae TaxID=2905831 RepID=UPI001E30B16E|nr:N-acyl homoserine lactonase family protein [Pseudonocardia terrae]MCE3554453.1 N-acyl homoserine lactonase family protein [Pseudonocardia terrae]